MKGAEFSSHRRAPTAAWQSQSHILVDTVIHDLQFNDNIGLPLIFAGRFILEGELSLTMGNCGTPNVSEINRRLRCYNRLET